MSYVVSLEDILGVFYKDLVEDKQDIKDEIKKIEKKVTWDEVINDTLGINKIEIKEDKDNG